MAKSMVYVKTYPDENYVVSSGIGFRLFYDSLQNKPRNMLLLSNAFAKAKIDSDIFLEYADPSTIPLLYQDDIYNYGDFCWVDYEYDEDKKKISEQTEPFSKKQTVKALENGMKRRFSLRTCSQ